MVGARLACAKLYSMAYAAPAAGRRLVLLDSLRGVAAIGVLLYHIGLCFVGEPKIAVHGYLAVDFFFVLSGFVIAGSYGERIDAMGPSAFTRTRLRRLLPLSILGVLLGLCYLLARWAVSREQSDSLAEIVSATALNLLLIPKPWVASHSLASTFPANPVLWSLSLELIGNMIWSLRPVRSSAWAAFLLAGAGLGLTALGAAHAGSADIGWDWASYLGGFGRMLFGFFTGVLLWRFRPTARPSAAIDWIAPAVLCAVLLAPASGWILDLTAIVLVFPALVYFSAMGGRTGESRLSSGLGELSYPLYAIHYPVVMLMAGVVYKLSPASKPGYAGYLVAAPVIALAVAAAVYDKRIRTWRAGSRGRGALAPQSGAA